jgi:hypothetical protein
LSGQRLLVRLDEFAGGGESQGNGSLGARSSARYFARVRNRTRTGSRVSPSALRKLS